MNNHNPSPKTVGLLLSVSGLIGFSLGAFVFPALQDCLEPSQVLAGLVRYPPHAPQGLFFHRSWTLLIHLSAVGLSYGLSEMLLSILISGLAGMLSFQALALFMFAINQRFWVALLFPLLVFGSSATAFWNVYPVALMGFFATAGLVGLPYMLLLVAVFGIGWHRSGAFLLGLAPYWHLTLGGLMWPVVLLAWIWNNKKPWPQHRGVASWFLAGAAITLVSFGIHQINLPPLPAVPATELRRHLLFFIENWDAHRRPGAVDFLSAEVGLNLLGLAVCFTYLKKNAATIPDRLRLLLTVLFVAGTLALVFGGLTRLPLAWLPLDLVRAMPARLLNLFVLSYATLIGGLLTRNGGRGIEQVLATGFISLLSVSAFLPFPVARTVVLGTLVVGGALLLLRSTSASRIVGQLAVFNHSQSPLKLGQVLLLAGYTVYVLANHRQALLSWGVIPKSQAIAQAYGTPRTELILPSSSFVRTQFFTRQPILLATQQLDNLSYFPQMAPTVAAILKDVYGVDYFNPPVESLHTGELFPRGIERGLWESWSLERWRTVREKYHVEEVFVPASWKLQLPVSQRITISGNKFMKYHIPVK